jgi:menaquinone-dependent protoporphyrinogen IX oxidase
MEDRQGVRVLVAFATRSGATADVARAVADRLSERGGRVDVRRVQDVTEC